MPTVVVRLLLRRGRLTDIVQQHREADDQVLIARAHALLREGVETKAGVRPGATLRMPLRILRYVDHRVQLRVEARPTAGPQELQAERGAATAEQQLRPLLHQALRGKVDLRERRAKGDGLRGHGELETGGELHRAQDAQRVFGELCGHVPQHLGLEVGAAAPGIDELAGRGIPEDRVERKVAPLGGVFRRHRRVRLDLEIRMLHAGAVLAARHGDVDRQVLELGHAEGRADGHDPELAAQGGLDRARTQAVDLDVEIGDGHAHQSVAHATADEARAAPGGAEQLQHAAQGAQLAVEADQVGQERGHDGRLGGGRDGSRGFCASAQRFVVKPSLRSQALADSRRSPCSTISRPSRTPPVPRARFISRSSASRIRIS